MSSAIPAIFTALSTLWLTGCLVMSSQSKNTSRPPSSAGIGSRFMMPRLELKRSTQLASVSTTARALIWRLSWTVS